MGLALQTEEPDYSETFRMDDGLDVLVEWAEPAPGIRALDIATHGADMAFALAACGADLTLVDGNPDTLRATCELLGAQGHAAAPVVADTHEMPFAAAEFDLVTCRVAAHHFTDHAAFFAEVERVLSPGGRFAFQDHSLPEHTAAGVFVDSFERLRDPSHVRARSAAEWIAAVEAAGLIVERHEVVEKRHDFFEWCARCDCDVETMAALTAHARRLPRMAAEWLNPEWRDDTDPELPLASQRRALLGFTNRHVVMLARKPAA